MAVHLQIRDVPDDLHQILRQRAAAGGVSLRQYTLEILREHCALPTMDEWLDGLHRLRAVSLSAPAAVAVGQARDADDDAVVDALGRP